MLSFIDTPSPNFNERPDGQAPDMIVIHYTGMETAEAALQRLCDPAAEVSAHFTIELDGRIHRHVDPIKRAWHAGVSHWNGRDNINNYSIGIELVNKGHEFGYHPFPDVQINALISLIKDLRTQYEIPLNAIIGHEDCAPDRKQDPGELFPWDHLRSALNL